MIGAIFKMQLPPTPTSSFKPGLKVLFPQDLKVTRNPPPPEDNLPIQTPASAVSQRGREKDTQKREKPGGIKKCTRHLVLPTRSAKSQTTQAPFRHHRGRVGDGSPQDDIKGAGKKAPPPHPHTHAHTAPPPSIPDLSGVLAEFCLLSYLGCDEGAGGRHFGFPGRAEQRRLLLGAVV